MYPSSKSQEDDMKSKTNESEGEDQISNLPDEILCHILSFIPTKYAVRTSLLSTRWKPLWTSVPVIEFHCSNLKWNKDTISYYDFMDFVDKFMFLHNWSSIDRFRLQCEYGYDEYDSWHITSLICTAIKFNVQEFVLIMQGTALSTLSIRMTHLFTSVNLVVLKLVGNVIFQFPMSVFLPTLKVLHLHFLTFLDDDSFKNLLSGCPVLEELDIQRSRMDSMKTLCIYSSTLKKLYVWNGSRDQSFHYGVVINTPALEILEFVDYSSKVFDVNEFTSLVKADFDFSMPGCDSTERSVLGMLGKISNVQNLSLREDTFKFVVQTSAYNLLLFPKLSHLYINLGDISWSLFPDFLRCMPNLKVLVVDQYGKLCNNLCPWCVALERVPKCLSLCLEIIEFRWRGEEMEGEEMKLLRYLLENAKVLMKLTVSSWPRNDKTETNILNVPRGSRTCQIEFSSKW